MIARQQEHRRRCSRRTIDPQRVSGRETPLRSLPHVPRERGDDVPRYGTCGCGEGDLQLADGDNNAFAWAVMPPHLACCSFEDFAVEGFEDGGGPEDRDVVGEWRVANEVHGVTWGEKDVFEGIQGG